MSEIPAFKALVTLPEMAPSWAARGAAQQIENSNAPNPNLDKKVFFIISLLNEAADRPHDENDETDHEKIQFPLFLSACSISSILYYYKNSLFAPNFRQPACDSANCPLN
jgi:hypothetical protein